jgi:sphinganine-1-phosphate aldolase
MYRNRDYRENQFFSTAEWPGGIYVSPTIAGSRPGATIAMTWATMLYFGRKGYVQATREIIEVVQYIKRE